MTLNLQLRFSHSPIKIPILITLLIAHFLFYFSHSIPLTFQIYQAIPIIFLLLPLLIHIPILFFLPNPIFISNSITNPILITFTIPSLRSISTPLIVPNPISSLINAILISILTPLNFSFYLYPIASLILHSI